MNIGRKLYYELPTGNILVDTGERTGDVVETTQEQDFTIYAALTSLEPSAVGCLQLDYGAYAEDYQAGGRPTRVDLSTQLPVFSYPDPTEEAPVTYTVPLSTQVETLQTQLAQTNADMASFMDYILSTTATE